MIPVSLSLKGFLSYREPTEVDFYGVNTACVSGPNGAGKSSLFDAITWSLFGRARRNDDALINDASQFCYVSFEFLYENDRYRVQREKGRESVTVLEFQIQTPEGSWKPLTEAGMRATEERIRDVLRLDYETFINASFFLQGKADMFTQQPAGKRKEILSSVLGLEIWESYREEASRRRREAEGNVRALRALLEEVLAELAEEDERKEKLRLLRENLEKSAALRDEKEKSWEQIRERMEELRILEERQGLLSGQLERFRSRLEEAITRLNSLTEELEKKDAVLENEETIKKDYARWKELRESLERYNETSDAFHRLQGRYAALEANVQAEAARLKQEMTGLQALEKEMDAIAKELPSIEERQEKEKEKLVRLEAAAAELPEAEEKLNDMQQERARLKADNARIREKMNEVKERISRLEKSGDAECPLCGQDLSESHRQEMLVNLTEEGKEMGSDFRATKERMQDIEGQISETGKKILEIRKERVELSQVQASLGRLSQQTEDIRKRLQSWQQDGRKRLEIVSRLIKNEGFASENRKEISELQSSIQALGYDETAHEKIRNQESAARESEEKFLMLENARSAVESLRRETAALRAAKYELTNDIKGHEKEFAEIEEKISDLKEKLKDADVIRKELDQMIDEENILRQKVGGAQQMVDVLDFQKEKREEYQNQIDDQASLITQLTTLETAFGKDGVPALLIEQALPDIEYQANDILDKLSGGRMSVSFETERAYKDRSREDKKQTLDILISDASGQREYELFSGGEAFRINFAVRLALSRVLAGRAGARLQTLVVDEGFGSQDAEGRQRLIEAINMVSPDFEKILVITHLEDLKDAFPSRIEVRKESGTSRVEVIP